ncbi:AMP-binding protein, partial [Acinetobacter baumannii]
AAAVLHSRGIRKGDVVAVVLPNRVELVVLLFAAWRLGAAVTPVRPDATEDELRYQILDAGARVVVAEDGRDPGFLDVARVAGPD